MKKFFKVLLIIIAVIVCLFIVLCMAQCIRNKINEKDYVREKTDITDTVFEWPQNSLTALLPKPVSSKGAIETDRSNALIIYVSHTSLEDYQSYVNGCKENGFVVDYRIDHPENGKASYFAENTDGIRLSLEYSDTLDNYKYTADNVMEIYIYVPDEKSSDSSGGETEEGYAEDEPMGSDTEEDSYEDESSAVPESSSVQESSAIQESNADSSDGGSSVSGEVTASFRQAMDKYEAFFDEYIAFMERYKQNSNDMSLFSEYTDYLKRYTDFIKELQNIDSSSLSYADAFYYAEVSARIYKKLEAINNN